MKPAELLPQVYDELRKLAAAKLAGEKPGHTLDATALVHEAYLKLGGERSFATSARGSAGTISATEDCWLAESRPTGLVRAPRSTKRDRHNRSGDGCAIPVATMLSMS
jgi:hypothetical protein